MIFSFYTCFSDSESDWITFARSGSLLVCIALVLAIIDHQSWVKNAIPTSQKYRPETYSNIEKAIEDTIKEEIKTFNLKKSENEIKYLTNLRYNEFLEKQKSEKAHETRSRFQRVELAIGLVGTLIWGFGDLIQNT